MRKLPFAIDKKRLQVIVWVFDGISRAAITDLKVTHFFICSIDQLVPVARASLESRTHTRKELCFSRIGNEDGIALQYVDELILPGMSVA